MQDTIAAIATAMGPGAIAIVRVSGSEAIPLVEGVFDGPVRLSAAQPRTVHFGALLDDASVDTDSGSTGTKILDEVLVTVFRKPQSFTGEDVVEIGCHGGSYLSRRILKLLLQRGVRMAQPGEFSLRAFVNGKIDLCRAEAVADLINARTEASLQSALGQYRGAMSGRIEQIRAELIEICAMLELDLDFSEEDVEFASREAVIKKTVEVSADLSSLLDTFDRGRLLREGVKVVLAGKPNVGKSSLLNALLRHERAIVTQVPGTTRDTIEEQLDVRGVLFRVTDTAGLHEGGDIVEQEGMKRTASALQSADIVVVLFDVSETLDPRDRAVAERILHPTERETGKPALFVLNKTDLARKAERAEVERICGQAPIVEVSAKESMGLPELEDALISMSVGPGPVTQEEAVISNMRQKQGVECAVDSLRSAAESLKEGLSGEFVSMDMRAALGFLAEVMGAVSSEDILDSIFTKFCIGK